MHYLDKEILKASQSELGLLTGFLYSDGSGGFGRVVGIQGKSIIVRRLDGVGWPETSAITFIDDDDKGKLYWGLDSIELLDGNTLYYDDVVKLIPKGGQVDA